MMVKPRNEQLRRNRTNQDIYEFKRTLTNAEYDWHESMCRLTACQRRIDRGARRGRGRQVSQCLSAPYRANAAQQRALLVRSLHQESNNFVLRGREADAAASPGAEFSKEDEALLEEVVAKSPELRLELEAAAEAAKRRPDSALAARRRSSGKAPAEEVEAAAAVRTDMSDTVISAFLERLDATASSVDPLETTLLLNGSQPMLRRSRSASALEAGHSRVAHGRLSLLQRRASSKARLRHASESVERGARPDGDADCRSSSRSPGGGAGQLQELAWSTPDARRARRETSPASCGLSPQAQSRMSVVLGESSRQASRTKSPGGCSRSSQGSPQNRTPLGRMLVQQRMSASEEV